ncbi:A/G-specific adenine glycosylase [Desulfoplanes sp.]
MDSTRTIQKNILAWFAQNRRDLPWRRDYGPYKVWISEIMLQQTQMERGVDYFKRWITRFPTVESVADAHEDDVLKLWEGLGYYQRARNLHKTAKIITDRYGGRFPDGEKELESLPGIGPYTAAAIASIAFNRPVAVLDANVTRVLARIFDIDTPVSKSSTRAVLASRATALLPTDQARNFNQAMMELGALVCTKTPKCLSCPIMSQCASLEKGNILERPVLKKRPETIPITMVSGVLIHRERVFIQKRCDNDLWANLWEFPGGSVIPGEPPEDAVVREFLEETEIPVVPFEKVAVINHSYTRYRVSLHAFLCSAKTLKTPVLHAAQQWTWARFHELDSYAFPAGHRKLINILMEKNLLQTHKN